MNIHTIFLAIDTELESAHFQYPNNFHSAHEGYAVILEEFEEAWEEIKAKNPDRIKIQKEIIQVAAMCVRFLEDLM